MKEIKAVFIDIDNTLLDFDGYVIEAMKNGFLKYGIGEYKDGMSEVFQRVNNELWKSLEKGEIDFMTLRAIRWNKVFDILGLSFDGVEFEKYFRKYLHESAIAIEGAYELLSYLKRKYIVCIASNGPHIQQTHRIELADMDKYIDYYFTSEKMGVSKPKEEYFKKCFNSLNENRDIKISPEETIMIGDSLTSDIYGAKEFGMRTILIERGNEVNKGYLNNADYTVYNLLDIIKLLEE